MVTYFVGKEKLPEPSFLERGWNAAELLKIGGMTEEEEASYMELRELCDTLRADGKLDSANAGWLAGVELSEAGGTPELDEL